MLRRKNKESLTSFLYSKSVCRGTDLSKLKGLSVVFNTESIYHFYVNKDYREYVLRCKNVFIDGAMLVFGARLIRWKINRYHGPDLLSDLEEQGICKNSVLIGGSNSNHILEKNSVVKKWIKLPYTKSMGLLFKRQSHKLIVTMTYAWYLLGSQSKSCCPVFSLTQKSLIKKHYSFHLVQQLTLELAFDNVQACFWQRLGLEWLPRMIREPRMVKRIYFSLIGFIFLLGKR